MAKKFKTTQENLRLNAGIDALNTGKCGGYALPDDRLTELVNMAFTAFPRVHKTPMV